MTALADQVPDRTPDDVVEKVVRQCFAQFEGARVREFVGVLVTRSALARLREQNLDREA